MSTTLIVFSGMDPATAKRPSGVTYTLWIAPVTGTRFTLVSDAVSMTSTAPGATAMPAYTFRPSGVMAMLFGRPLNGMRAWTFNVSASTASTVCNDSFVKYSRLPSGAAVTPCGISMSSTTPTTVFDAIDEMRAVTGRIRLDDPNHGPSTLRRERLAAHPRREDLPLRVGRRAPVLASAVEGVAAGLTSERMPQQATLLGASSDDELAHAVEVLPRLRFGPRERTRREGLEPEVAGRGRMTRDASHVPGPLHEEHRLDPRSIRVEVQRRRRLGEDARRQTQVHERDGQPPLEPDHEVLHFPRHRRAQTCARQPIAPVVDDEAPIMRSTYAHCKSPGSRHGCTQLKSPGAGQSATPSARPVAARRHLHRPPAPRRPPWAAYMAVSATAQSGATQSTLLLRQRPVLG
ncbi:MAG: hypothetical protein U0Q12_14985 [Vicinamibacterales bacterium]